MDPITLILTALVAGAATGALDAFKGDVKTAFESLNSRLRKRFAGDAAALDVLDEYERDPATFQASLERKLASTGAADDPELLSAAQRVLDLVDAEGAAAGRYVPARGSRGVQIGIYSTQVNVFNSPPSQVSIGGTAPSREEIG